MTARQVRFAVVIGVLVVIVLVMRNLDEPIVPTAPSISTVTTVALADQVDLELNSCRADDAVGYVVNNSAVTVDVFVEVQFLDVNGTVIEDSNDWVRGLRPGERGRWAAPWLGQGIYRQCRANVGGVFQ